MIALVAFLGAYVAGSSCGPQPSTPGGFGEVTSAVVLVNPVINQGSSTTVQSGPSRADLELKAGDLAPVKTDSKGLAIINELPTGAVTLKLGDASTTFQVVNEKELYDVVLAYDGSALQQIIPAVRYPIGGAVVTVAPGGNIADAAADGAIVMLEEGTYPGNFEIRGEGALIFGLWSEENGPLSTIEGDVTVLGGNTRMRGVKVTGKLTSNANSFSAAFCDVGSANITGNGVSLIRNRFTGGSATVPSSNAELVDNEGIP